jgi:hypothetical protein
MIKARRASGNKQRMRRDSGRPRLSAGVIRWALWGAVVIGVGALGAASLSGQSPRSFETLSDGEKRAMVDSLQETARPVPADDREERFERELPEAATRAEHLGELARKFAAGRSFAPNPAERLAELAPSRLPRLDTTDSNPDGVSDILADLPPAARDRLAEVLP